MSKETVDKVYEESIKLWRDVYKFKADNKHLDDETFKKGLEEFHNSLCEKYANFFYTFPIVGKLIVLSSMYHPNPMKNYLEYYFKNYKAPTNYKDFVDYQTDYVYYYWKDIYSNTAPGTRKLSSNQIEQIAKKEKNKLKDELITQFTNFKSAYDKVMTEKNNLNIEIKKEKLKNYIKTMVD